MTSDTTVFIDLETGGLGPNHPDIQVAAIAVRGWREIETYEAKIQFDEARAEPEVLAMNSYDPEAWRTHAKPESRVVAELGALLRRHLSIGMVSQRGKVYRVARIAGHNVVNFDAPRLKAMFARCNAFLPVDIYLPLDTLQLALWQCAMWDVKPASYKVSDLCRQFGVSLTDGHDALSDVRATIHLARELMRLPAGQTMP